MNFDEKKGPGQDEISPSILRNIFVGVKASLTFILNLSLASEKNLTLRRCLKLKARGIFPATMECLFRIFLKRWSVNYTDYSTHDL
jgi:hypothetical protein